MILPKFLDDCLRIWLKRHGYVFMRRTNPYHYLGRRMMLMRSCGIDLVLDVGANTGQYAQRLRELGYTREIVSFEPMHDAFSELSARCASDPTWSGIECGLGDFDGSATINVSGNSISSSILPMLPEHELHAPASHIVRTETIHMRRLQDVFVEHADWQQRRIWMKIDVQGYEDKVLAGAGICLERVDTIQMELSLRPLYAGQMTIQSTLAHMAGLGFEPVAFEPGFEDRQSGEYLQVDGIFRNRRKAREAGLKSGLHASNPLHI